MILVVAAAVAVSVDVATCQAKLAGLAPQEIDIDSPTERERFLREMTAEADKERDEQIDEIRRAPMPRQRAPQYEGELTWRLAETYWMKHKFMLMVAQREHERAREKWDGAGRVRAEPVLADFTRISDAYRAQALKSYQLILDRFPEYARLVCRRSLRLPKPRRALAAPSGST